jgi:hypothetical protein
MAEVMPEEEMGLEGGMDPVEEEVEGSEKMAENDDEDLKRMASIEEDEAEDEGHPETIESDKDREDDDEADGDVRDDAADDEDASARRAESVYEPDFVDKSEGSDGEKEMCDIKDNGPATDDGSSTNAEQQQGCNEGKENEVARQKAQDAYEREMAALQGKENSVMSATEHRLVRRASDLLLRAKDKAHDAKVTAATRPPRCADLASCLCVFVRACVCVSVHVCV